ncbi:MarR family winged helix-turn-helix transcriptional regulator [Streptomyces sp. NPDC059398]|uniref:MarR family winged helix-turn-helix transcriptional regulator n=1 Tax=Streptomyces sp. NPDC059398 TaxID=3346820 RepID=UPI00367EF249
MAAPGNSEEHPTDAVDMIAAQWHRERADLGHLDAMALVGRITRASGLLQKRMKPVFTQFGLEFGEFDVLATLRRAGAPYELTAGGLLRSAMVTSGAITNRLDRLEKKGLITRGAHPTDRRAVNVRLTAEGLGLVDAAVVAHVENEARMLSGLTAAERTALGTGLRKLLVSLGDTELG